MLWWPIRPASHLLRTPYPEEPLISHLEVPLRNTLDRQLRNRVAHHDSLLNIDIPFEVERIFTVAGHVHPDFETWLRQVDRSGTIYGERPASPVDTVLIPAKQAWPQYQQLRAYICQPGRWFNDVAHLSFCTDQEIKPEIPLIKYRRDDVAWTRQEASRLRETGGDMDKKIAQVIGKSIDIGVEEGKHQVFLLSAPKDSGRTRHRTLPHSVPHLERGRGSAFVRKQRYVSLHSLETASSTADLIH